MGIAAEAAIDRAALDPAYSRIETAEKQASANGCVVITPKNDELFIDIDDEAGMVAFEKGIENVATLLPCTWEKRPSPSGRDGRFHIVVTLTDRDLESDAERILLQALLGSDRTREVLSWQRMVRGETTPTLFFEKEGVTF